MFRYIAAQCCGVGAFSRVVAHCPGQYRLGSSSAATCGCYQFYGALWLYDCPQGL